MEMANELAVHGVLRSSYRSLATTGHNLLLDLGNLIH